MAKDNGAPTLPQRHLQFFREADSLFDSVWIFGILLNIILCRKQYIFHSQKYVTEEN